MSLVREHTEYHERRLEQQMLDALLRIEEVLNRTEELLKAFLVLLPVQEYPTDDELDEPPLAMSMFVSKEDLEAAKRAKPKGKRK